MSGGDIKKAFKFIMPQKPTLMVMATWIILIIVLQMIPKEYLEFVNVTFCFNNRSYHSGEYEGSCVEYNMMMLLVIVAVYLLSHGNDDSCEIQMVNPNGVELPSKDENV